MFTVQLFALLIGAASLIANLRQPPAEVCFALTGTWYGTPRVLRLVSFAAQQREKSTGVGVRHSHDMKHVETILHSRVTNVSRFDRFLHDFQRFQSTVQYSSRWRPTTTMVDGWWVAQRAERQDTAQSESTSRLTPSLLDVHIIWP
jgi:hypothetical protein